MIGRRDRNRYNKPELMPEALYVAAPRDVLTWAGRDILLHCPVVSVCGKEFPRTARWRVLRVRDVPGHMTILSGEPCPYCSLKPRLQVEAALLRDPKIAGWLPL